MQWTEGPQPSKERRGDLRRSRDVPLACADIELSRLATDTDQAAMAHWYAPDLVVIAETVRRVMFAVRRRAYTARDITDLRALLPAAKRVDVLLHSGFAPRLEHVIALLAEPRLIVR